MMVAQLRDLEPEPDDDPIGPLAVWLTSAFERVPCVVLAITHHGNRCRIRAYRRVDNQLTERNVRREHVTVADAADLARHESVYRDLLLTVTGTHRAGR